jgi:hypothetical protein
MGRSAMSKIIATAHIVVSISTAILLGVRYVNAMEFRACMNHDDVVACGEKCVIIGNVDFYLQPPRTVAVKVVPVRPNMQPSIYSLENCVIIDQRNWSCSQDQNGVWARQEMVDGKYHTTVIVDGKSSLSHCAR